MKKREKFNYYLLGFILIILLLGFVSSYGRLVNPDSWVDETGDNMTGDLGLGGNNINNVTNITVERIIQGNYTLHPVSTNGRTIDDAFCLEMPSPEGDRHCKLVIQPGGSGQASIIRRSFATVNDNVCLGENATNMQCYADVGNFTWNIDFNTSISGADLGVADDLEVIGEIYLRNSAGQTRFFTRALDLNDELHENIFFNDANLSISNGVLNINDTLNETLVVNLDRTETIFSVKSDSITLNTGTDLNPAINHITYQNENNPTLTITTSEPSVSHAEVVITYVGASTNNIYLFKNTISHNEKFIDQAYDTFDDIGGIYKSGLDQLMSSTQLNISNGVVRLRMNILTYSNDLVSTDGFFYINNVGDFIQCSDNSCLTDYLDDSSISNNKYFSIVWGVVSIDNNQQRLMVILQGNPGSGKEYNTALKAEEDPLSQVNFFPSNEDFKSDFIPVARTIHKRTGNNDFVEFPTTSELFQDLRGKATVASGGVPSPPITDHDILDNLEFDISGHTFDNVTGVLNFKSYDINGSGNLETSGTMTAVNFQLTSGGGGTFKSNGNCLTNDGSPCNIFMSTAGEVGINGQQDPQNALDVFGVIKSNLNNTNTNAINDILILEHSLNTGSTPASGIGLGLNFRLQDLGGVEKQGGIDLTLDTVTDGSEDATMCFVLNVNGGLDNMMCLNGSSQTMEMNGTTIIVNEINDTLGNKYAKYQSTTNNFNGSGNFVTTGNGTFDSLAVGGTLIISDAPLPTVDGGLVVQLISSLFTFVIGNEASIAVNGDIIGIAKDGAGVARADGGLGAFFKFFRGDDGVLSNGGDGGRVEISGGAGGTGDNTDGNYGEVLIAKDGGDTEIGKTGSNVMIDEDGNFVFIGLGSGFAFGEIYGENNTIETNITGSGKANKVQIKAYQFNGLGNDMSNNFGSGRLISTKVGVYDILITMSVSTNTTDNDKLMFSLYNDTGATEFGNIHATQDYTGGENKTEDITLSGRARLGLNEPIEVWGWNEDDTDNFIVHSINFKAMQIGG